MVRTFRLLAPRTLAGRLFLATLTALLLAALTACGGSEPAAPTPTEVAAAVATVAPAPTVQVSATVPTAPTAAAESTPTPLRPQPVYGGTVRNVATNVRTPDPWHILSPSSSWGRTFFNGLVELKFPYEEAKGPQHQPGLATEWSQSQDGTKWTLKLRQGVTFHDGEVFNADDVVATYERALDPGVLIPTRPATIRGVFKGIKKVDDQTVVLDTGEYPNSAAFAYIANNSFSIVPEHLIRGDRSSTDPKLRWKFMGPSTTGTLGVGTGPFIMKKWDTEVEMIGERNPNYWARDEQGNRLPYLDRIEYPSITDNTRIFANFVSGQLSICCGAGIPPWQAVDLCKRTRQPGCYAGASQPHGNYEWFLNPGKVDAFKNPKVVQAARYGNDHQKSIDETFGRGIGYIWMDRARFPETALTLKEQYEVLPWSNPDRRPEFFQKAKDLLTEAGYPNGIDLPLPIFGGCSITMIDFFTREVDRFNQAGFKAPLECRQGIVIAEELKAGRWSIADGPQNIWIMDPGTMVISKLLFESAALGGSPWRYEGQAEVDRKFRLIQREVDPAKRNEGYRDLERHLANDQLTVWSLGISYVVRSVHGCVHNYGPGGIWESGSIALNFVWVTKECK